MSKSLDTQYWVMSGLSGLVPRAVIRTFQFLGGIIVIVLYGLDMASATNKGSKAGSMWIYSMFVAAVSILVCIFHLFFTVAKCGWNALDWIIFILWVAEFGVFGSIYLGSKPMPAEAAYSDRNRMLAAVWIDMINMLLWFASASIGIILCGARRHERKTLRAQEGLKLEDINREHATASIDTTP